MNVQPINFSFRSRIPETEVRSTTYMTHGLYSYPAKFIPHVPYYVIKKYARQESSVVLDPFGGSATTAIEAVRLGHNCIVMDNNPIVDVLAPAKTMQLDFNLDDGNTALELNEPADGMSRNHVNINRIIEAIQVYPHNFVPAWKNIDHWVEPEFKPILEQVWGYLNDNPEDLSPCLLSLLKIAAMHVTDYFSNGALDVPKLFKSKNRIKQIDRLKQRFQQNPGLPYSLLKEKFKKYHAMVKEFNDMIAGNNTIVTHFDEKSIKNLDFARISPDERFVLSIGGVDSINYQFPDQYQGSVDIIITSPPYVYAQEYIRSSKSHLYWLGIIDDLRATELTRSEIGHRKGDTVSRILQEIGHVDSFASSFGKLLEIEQQKYGKNGKYTPFIATYFHDMHRAIGNMKLLLKDGGIFGLFVGNPTVLGIQIECSKIFSDFFEDQGYEVLEYGYDPIVNRQLLKGRKNENPNGMDFEWLIIARKLN